MGLIKCPDCGKEISDIAPSCPQCGRPMARSETADRIAALASLIPPPPTKAQQSKTVKKTLVGCLALVVGLAIVIAIASSGDTASDDAPAKPASPALFDPGRFSKGAIVWLSEDAMNDGIGLISQGVRDVESLGRYISCAPAAGARYAVLDPGVTKAKVQVLDGEDKGCVGWVTIESLNASLKH